MTAILIPLAIALTASKADVQIAEQFHEMVDAAGLKLPFVRAVTLDISPDGQVLACEAGDGQGAASSMEQVCSLALKLRFRNVAKIDGMPAFGRAETVVMGYDGGGKPPQFVWPRDLVLSVNRLPKGVKGFLDINLNLLVSAAGGRLTAAKMLRTSTRPTRFKRALK
ncbi:hypothetical protein ACFSTD_09405 [Novosphingobium colocasiae]